MIWTICFPFFWQFQRIFPQSDSHYCFVHSIFRLWFLVTFGNKVMKIQQYYKIFVYILQGKMGKTERKSERKSYI